MLSKTKLALALGLVWGLVPTMASAQTAPETEGGITRLNEITVSATRTERRVDKVPNTVTVTTAASIEQLGVRDIRDVFRDELDVSVRAAPPRFTVAGTATGRAGNEGINIRGLEGNQVLMLVDGIRVPNSFSFGSFATGRGDFLDVDGIKTVEVLRGPVSTQFGSDGLAGAVSFRTLDPADLLKPGQPIAGFARASYASTDRSWSETLGVAGTQGPWQAMLSASYRQGNEVGNKGDNDAQDLTRTSPNPLDYNSRSLLGKIFLALDAVQQIQQPLSAGQDFSGAGCGATDRADRRENRRQNTEVFSARAVPPLTSTSTLDLDTQDRIERNRVSLEHRFNDFNASGVQRAETRVYWQDAQVSQFGAEDRNTAADRTRDNRYSSKVAGFSALLGSNLTGFLNQRLTYGVDWSRAEISGVRDGTVAPFGETFPTRPFPETAYTLAGAFVQSEMEVGAFSIFPGLRLDHYTLSPAAAGYVGGAAVALSGQALTPRLGVVWQLEPWLAPYGQLAKGFRAPTPEQVNNGFTNLASGYTSIGNANIQAEKADSIEIGLRGRVEGLRYALAAFDNRYTDFISQQAVSGAGTPANPTVFQYTNLAHAHIYGLEARAEWQISRLWQARAGIASSRGETEANGVNTPLDTVQPAKAAFGVRYDAGLWGARANVSYSAGKDSSQIASGNTQFAPAPYTLLDMGFHWKPVRNVSVNANLNNALDARYWRWSDVSGLASNSPVKDAYTAAGRNLQASVRYDF